VIKAYFEGICQPNKDGGKMIYEVIIYQDGNKIYDNSHVLERYIASNNIAEYAGLISLLKWIISNQFKNEHIHIFTDSRLVEGQMMNEWNIKSGKYKSYAEYAIILMNEISDSGNIILIEWKPVKKQMMSIPLLLGRQNDGVFGSVGRGNDITQLFLERKNKL
jgi:ribonuclease HI